MENILLVGAHFDDIELGCGGTAARLVADGKKVYKLILINILLQNQVYRIVRKPVIFSEYMKLLILPKYRTVI